MPMLTATGPGSAPPPPAGPPPGGGGGGDGPGEPRFFSGEKPLLGNAQVAMIFFIGAELMFFSGLISAFLIFRFSGKPWPPPFQPRLPVGMTAVNTALLIASSFTMVRAQRSLRRGDAATMAAMLTATGLLGVLFLGIQGYEWLRMLRFGLTAAASTYGSTFYTIIGAHGAHVLGAVVWLIVVLIRARGGHYSPQKRTGLITCAMYWHMVVGLWPVLFILVYLV